jgi:mutator protein MutT
MSDTNISSSAIVKVAAGIIIRNHAVIVCQRPATATYPFKWEFPGGKLESGETSAQCLERELFEELSIHCTAGTILHIQQWDYQSAGNFEVIFHRVENFSGTIKTNVHHSYRWVEKDELLRVDLLEGNKVVIPKIMELL